MPEKSRLKRKPAAHSEAEVASRLKAEAEAKENQEIFSLLFEFAPDAIVVVNQNGGITRANAKTEELFGYGREELMGEPIELLIPDRFTHKHVGYRSTFLDEPHTRPMGFGLNLYAKRKDGTEFPVDILLSPVQMPHDRLVLAVVRDITQRKRAEEAAENLAAIVESSGDAIIGKTLDGTITSWNKSAEKLYGYSSEEVLGRSISLLLPPERPDELPALLQRVAHGESIEAYESERLRKDGKLIFVSLAISPMKDSSGQVIGASTIGRDITAHKLAEAQVKEAMRHELQLKEIHQKELHHRTKNNLQVISSLLYLQSTYVSDSQTLNILQESQNRVKSIALIHEKLYCSEDIEKLDFGDYVRALVADVFSTYGVQHGGIAVHTDIEKMFFGIDTAIPCGLIINELVSNVLKHAFLPGAQGEVWIDLHKTSEAKCVLSVRDNGRGLPADFDWRQSKSLGLKLVTDLTKQLDGVLDVIPKNGTMFLITFSELQYKERR